MRCSEAPGLGDQQTEKAEKSATGMTGCEEEGQGRTEAFPACERWPVAGASSCTAKAGCSESPGARSEFCCFKDDDNDFRRKVRPEEVCRPQASWQTEGVKAEDCFPWFLGSSKGTGQWRLSIWHRHTVCLFGEEKEPRWIFLWHLL